MRYEAELPLMLLFKKRWEQGQSAFSGISHKEVLKRSGALAVFLLLTNPEKVSVDVTPDGTVFFTAVYLEENAYIEAHFAAILALGLNVESVPLGTRFR